MRTKALALYKPPFRFEYGYIFDADHQTVADEASADSMINALRIRGWGRIGYMENPEALQDKVGELIAEALTQYWERQTKQDGGIELCDSHGGYGFKSDCLKCKESAA